MTWFILAAICFALAAMPALLFAINLFLFRAAPPEERADGVMPGVSLLIPARNEEDGIGACVEAALASRGVELEVIVLDDHSDDRTAQVVSSIAQTDPRVRVEPAPDLPEGWCGKQHACSALARLASHEVLAFIDADVQLAPDALARSIRFLEVSRADLASGFPRQETGSFLERLLIPLIHFVLLGYLPVGMMRLSRQPALGAGCGQFFIARRDSYERMGGHAAVRASLHDGIMLPRAFRRAGLHTDLFDASDMVSCRMYRSSAQTWRGLAKNATEGMAAPGAIVPWTVLLLGGQVLPLVLLAGLLLGAWGGWTAPGGPALHLLAAAVLMGYAIRSISALRYRQSWLGVLLHPLGVLLLVCIQWDALIRRLQGRPAQWRGRGYPVAHAAATPGPVRSDTGA